MPILDGYYIYTSYTPSFRMFILAFDTYPACFLISAALYRTFRVVYVVTRIAFVAMPQITILPM